MVQPLKLLILLLILSSIGHAEKQSFLPDWEDGTFSFYLDNDLFNGTDRDYTSGGRLAWISGKRKSLSDISSVQRHLNYLTGTEGSSHAMRDIWGFRDTSNLSYQYGVALTQQIFTPDTFIGERPLNERPYAGWLGLGFSLHVADDVAINSAEFTIGTVGPDSFAEETQDFVHETINSELFENWDSQIPNELTLNIHLSQKRRYHYFSEEDFPILPLSMTGFTELGLSLGNHLTEISAGWHFKLGYNIPVDFSDYRLSPTANSFNWNSHDLTYPFSAFLIGGIRGKAVLHDITLDGPLFRDFDTNAASEPLTFEFFYGVGVRMKAFEFSYIKTTRTKEYTSQEDHQDFGSVVLRYHY